MNDREVIHNIKRELFRMRREIDGMKKRKEKKEALRAYAELLTNLEMRTLNS